jgi:hypothetical protein
MSEDYIRLTSILKTIINHGIISCNLTFYFIELYL